MYKTCLLSPPPKKTETFSRHSSENAITELDNYLSVHPSPKY